MYKNANHPWEADPYQWVGLAKIRYDRQELERLRGRWEFELFQAGRRGAEGDWAARYDSRSVPSTYYHPDVGSFWFSAEAKRSDGTVLRSPGADESDAHGLSVRVQRVSVRDGPGFLGYVTSFFNVPGLFGSIPRQSNNYIGADCADLLVSAFGKWTAREPERNFNVDALVASHRRVAELDLADGKSGADVRWGPDVSPGDLVAVRYRGSGRYQHVGTLVKDDGNGLVDGGDTVLHAGPMPLAYATLGSGPFDGHLTILRPAPRVRERPISFSASRRAATIEYIGKRYGLSADTIEIKPQLIVLHWTGLPTLQASWRAFDGETLAAGRSDVAAGGDLNVSAHFLVDRDGSIHRLMPETWMARHVIGLNRSAIGIENVGGGSDRDDLTPAQAQANAWLIRELKDRFPEIEFLIGHHETSGFEGHPLWLEKDPGYRTIKSDPGAAFMRKVRDLVSDLGLQGPP